MRTPVGRRLLITLFAIGLVVIALQLGITAAMSRLALAALAAAGLLLGFVAVVLLNVLLADDKPRRHLARQTLVFSLTPPVLMVVPQAAGFSNGYSGAFRIGTIAWVALALLFSVFAVARLERQTTGARG